MVDVYGFGFLCRKMDFFLRNLEQAQTQAKAAALNAQKSAQGLAQQFQEHGKVFAEQVTENTKLLAEQVTQHVQCTVDCPCQLFPSVFGEQVTLKALVTKESVFAGLFSVKCCS